MYIAFRSGDNVTVFHWQHAHCSTIWSKRSVLLLKILLAYLFPNTAISVLALMGVVSLHVRCLFAPKFLWWKVTRDCTDKSINISEKLLTTTSDWDFLIYAASLHFRQAIKTSTPCVSHHPRMEAFKYCKGPQIHKQPQEKKIKCLIFRWCKVPKLFCKKAQCPIADKSAYISTDQNWNWRCLQFYQGLQTIKPLNA